MDAYSQFNTRKVINNSFNNLILRGYMEQYEANSNYELKRHYEMNKIQIKTCTCDVRVSYTVYSSFTLKVGQGIKNQIPFYTTRKLMGKGKWVRKTNI